MELEGLGNGGAGKGSKTVELAQGSETVSRPELRDGETGQSSCFCLFIGVFGRVNFSWIGNSGAGKGSKTAGWLGARRWRSSSGARRQRSWPELGLGDGGALLGLGATAKLAGAQRWRNQPVLASGDGKGLETAVLERGRRRRSLSGLRDGGARKGRRRPSWKGLEDGGAGQGSQTV